MKRKKVKQTNKPKNNEYRYVYREIEWDLPDDLNFSTDVKARSSSENDINSYLEEGLEVSFEVLKQSLREMEKKAD